MEYAFKQKGRDVYQKFITFMFMMEHGTNELITDMFCIKHALKINREDTEQQNNGQTYICKIEDGVLISIGTTGPVYNIEDKEVYSLVKEDRSQTYYYALNFSFMDTCLIENALELVEEMKNVTAVELKPIGAYKKAYFEGLEKLIMQIIKKYNMEEQYDDYV